MAEHAGTSAPGATKRAPIVSQAHSHINKTGSLLSSHSDLLTEDHSRRESMSARYRACFKEWCRSFTVSLCERESNACNQVAPFK